MWSVVLGISTQALIAAGVLFLEALRSRDPKVLICCLLGQCMGELGLAQGIHSLFLQCQPRAANGGTWELCSYVRAGNDCLDDAKGAGELWVAEGGTSESSVLH